MEAGERLRLFLALPLPAGPCEQLVAWQAAELVGVRDARIVPPGNLHVTLAFLGSRPAHETEAIVAELRAAAAGAQRPVLTVSRYRETRSLAMVVLEDEGGHASTLAQDLAERLERLGVYRREGRSWLPHVTVLRFRRPPGLHPPAPALGPVSPSEAALYTSVLRRTGAQYEIRDSVALGG